MRLDSRRLSACCVLVGSALALTACGSTVGAGSQVEATGSQLSSGLGELSAPSVPGGASNGVDPGVGTSANEPATSSVPSTSTGPQGAGAPGTQAGAGGGSGSAPAVRASGPVTVAYFVLKDTGSAFKALGYDGLSSGNGRAQIAAAVKIVNSHGGIGGRTINPVIYEADATGNPNEFYSAACAQFFEDNHAEALVSIVYSALLAACSKKAGAAYASATSSTASQADLDANRHVVFPAQLTVDKAAALLSQSLVDNGWLSAAKKPVIGLVSQDSPTYVGVERIVKSVLAKAGLALKDTAYMPADDIGQAATQGKAAALKFKSEGIDHVIGIESFDMSWFTLNAGQQSYYPKLGMSSLSLPGAFPALFNDKQLSGSAVIGWAPIMDVGVAQQPAVSARTSECLNAMKAAGENMSASLARLQALLMCEGSNFLADTFTTGTVNAAALPAGLSRLTKGFQSAVTFKSQPQRNRAAASAYRNASYSPGCKCYSYSGGLHPIG